MAMFEPFNLLGAQMKGNSYQIFADFYKASTLAQARLIDFPADSLFLIHIFSFMVESELAENDLIPFVRGIAEDVIIKKTIPHEDAPKKMAKAIRTAEYFSEFEKVLIDILDVWGIQYE